MPKAVASGLGELLLERLDLERLGAVAALDLPERAVGRAAHHHVHRLSLMPSGSSLDVASWLRRLMMETFLIP